MSIANNYYEIVDSTNIGYRGKYIQTHISDQGILRVFYIDESGDEGQNNKNTLHCAIVNSSNTRQVIYNSAYKRNLITEEKFNTATYGQHFTSYKYYSSPSNNEVFGNLNFENANINKFFIFPMHFKDNNVSPNSEQLYNNEGYSISLSKWWDGYFGGFALNIKNGWYSYLSGNVPDNYNFVNHENTMSNALEIANESIGNYPNARQEKLMPDNTNVAYHEEDNIIGNFSCATAPTIQLFSNAQFNKQFVMWLDYDSDSYQTMGFTLSHYNDGKNITSVAPGNAGDNYIFKGINTISNGYNEIDCMPYSDIDLDISWNTATTSINLELKTSDRINSESTNNIYVQVSNDGNSWYAPGTETIINIPHTSDSETTTATLFSQGISSNTSISVTYIVSTSVTQIRFINNGDDIAFLDYFRIDGTDLVEIQGVMEIWPRDPNTDNTLGWSLNSDPAQSNARDTPIRTFSVAFPTQMSNNNGTFGRPYFIIRDQQNKQALLGYAELSYDNEPNSLFTSVEGPYNILNTPCDTKFHKLKCEKKSLQNPGNWLTTGIHICFQKIDNDTGNKTLHYMKFNSLQSGNVTSNLIHDKFIGNEGAFCSLDLYNDNPRIAWYTSDNGGSIFLTYSNDGGNNWMSTGVEIARGVGIYNETKNQNYISLACSPTDDSIHISYYTDSEGIKYWTNSINSPKRIENTMDEAIQTTDSPRRINLNNENISLTTGTFKRYDESNIDIMWNTVSSKYNSLLSYRYPLRNWNNVPTLIQIDDSDFVELSNQKRVYTHDLDKICIAVRVKTPSDINSKTCTLFLIGGTNGDDGSYCGGTINGCIFFGIQSNFNSSKLAIAKQDYDGIPPTSGDIDAYGQFRLYPSTEYDLEFYYNKIAHNLTIKVKQKGEEEKTLIWSDISENGGFNASNGIITIGNGMHTTTFNEWCGNNKDGVINSIIIWNTDIENLPKYSVYRNDLLLKNNLITPYYNDYFDKSNMSFDTDYGYKVLTYGNKINQTQGIGLMDVFTDISPLKRFNELWNFELIQQPQNLIEDIKGSLYVTAIDKLDSHVWALLVEDTKNSEKDSNNLPLETEDKLYLIYSSDMGNTWQLEPNFISETVLNNINNVMGNYIKLFNDKNGAMWCFIGTEGYGIFTTNTYLNDNPLGSQLGDNWFQIKDANNVGLTETSNLSNYRSISYVYPVNIDKTDSIQIFGEDIPESDISDDEFHLWIGTKSPITNIIGNINFASAGTVWYASNWGSGDITVRDQHLYDFVLIAFSMVVKINGKLYETGLSKISIKPFTREQSGLNDFWRPQFQHPTYNGSTLNNFELPDNFVEWRAYSSVEVRDALNTGPNEYGENVFSQKYLDHGYTIYLGGEENYNDFPPGNGGYSPKVTARTKDNDTNYYTRVLPVTPWLEEGYNWHLISSSTGDGIDPEGIGIITMDWDIDTTAVKYPSFTYISEIQGSFDMVIRLNNNLLVNNEMHYKSNLIKDYLNFFSADSTIDLNNENLNVIDFGKEDDAKKYGAIGCKSFILTTKNSGVQWFKRLQTKINGIKPGNGYGRGAAINGIICHSHEDSSDLSGITLQMGTTPWADRDLRHGIGKEYDDNFKFNAYVPEKSNNGLIIVNNNSDFDKSFMPMSDSIEKVEHYDYESYWEPEYPPSLERTGGGNWLGDSKYKIDNTDDQINHWTFGHSDSIIKGSFDLLFHKNANGWQKISNITMVDGLTSIQPISSGDAIVWISNNHTDTGFYKITQKSPAPILNLEYPFSNNDFLCKITIENWVNYLKIYEEFDEITSVWRLTIKNLNTDLTITEFENDSYNGSDAINDLFRVFELEPSREYNFYVKSRTSKGDSWESKVTLTTPDPEPALTSFNAIAKFMNIKLEWEYNLNDSNSTDITSYKIIRETVNYLTEATSNKVIEDNLLNFPLRFTYTDIDDLKLGTIYKYKITPRSVDQIGEPFSTIVTIGSGIPEILKTIYDENTHTLKLTWLMDNIFISDNINNTTVTFDISKIRINDTEESDTLDGEINKTDYTAEYIVSKDFLLPGYTYKFYVRATYRTIYSNETSPWSEPVTFRLDAQNPSNFKANKDVDANNIRLSWDHVTSDRNEDIKYDLQYYDGSETKLISDISDNNYNFNLKSQRGGSIINYKVRTSYKFFKSDWTDSLYVDIPPHKPENIKAEGYTNDDVIDRFRADYILVTWDECVGVSNYTVKRFSIYSKNNMSDPDFIDIVTTNSYKDINYPLGERPIQARRYIYKVIANY